MYNIDISTKTRLGKALRALRSGLFGFSLVRSCFWLLAKLGAIPTGGVSLVIALIFSSVSGLALAYLDQRHSSKNIQVEVRSTNIVSQLDSKQVKNLKKKIENLHPTQGSLLHEVSVMLNQRMTSAKNDGSMSDDEA